MRALLQMPAQPAPVTPLETHLSVKEVAELLGVSASAVYRLSDDGTIPCVRVGARKTFSPQQVRQFVAQGGSEKKIGGKRRGRPSKKGVR